MQNLVWALMPNRLNAHHASRENALSYWLICSLFIVLWIAGGASRADALGQVLTRAASWGVLIAAFVTARGPNTVTSAVPARLFAAAAALVALQLVPLPPAAWTALPGRNILIDSATLIGTVQPWRPLSISPAGTMNALGSLVVPLAVLVLASRLRTRQHAKLLTVIVGLIFAANVIGILEFSGVLYDNPFLNDRLDQVNGSFANRNHFALFAALGVLMAPAWGLESPPSRWKPLVALGLVTLFLLVVLATGSRSGALLAGFALLLGLWIVRSEILAMRREIPDRIFWATVVASGALLLGALFASVALDRAVSVSRATELEASDDVRIRTLPIIVEMVGTYFPVGSGFGTFDPAFRIAEPDAMLRPQYFNTAHNDILQVALEGGALGLMLIALALVWWARSSLRAWKGGPALAKIGSAAIGLIALASITDYPARTPMIMAMISLAAVWLARSPDAERLAKPLPK